MLILAKTVSETFSSQFMLHQCIIVAYLIFSVLLHISGCPMQPTCLETRLWFQVLVCSENRNDKEFSANADKPNSPQWPMAKDTGCPSILGVPLHIEVNLSF